MTERYRLRPPSELDPEQRAVYDRIVGGPRAGQRGTVPITDDDGALLGPFGLMTIQPGVGDAVQGVGAALRFATELDAKTREAAILLVGARRRAKFEWIAHERAGAAAGLDDAQLAMLGRGEVPDGLDERAEHSLRVVAALLERATLSDDEFARASDKLGERHLVELVWLVGYYDMLALSLAVFDPPLGEGVTVPWED